MSYENHEVSQAQSKYVKALERLKDDDLGQEVTELIDTLLSLREENATVMNMSEAETPTKLDRLFTLAVDTYDVSPNSLRFLRDDVSADAVLAIRNKIKDYAYIKGRTKGMIQEEFALADEIAGMLAELVQSEFKEAA